MLQSKSIIENETGKTVQDKIFLNGYSSSGVFAQRFALLHPDIVETACIGGASGSIPIPTEKLSILTAKPNNNIIYILYVH